VGFVVLGILELSCVPRTDDDLTGGATEHVPEACGGEVGFKECCFGVSGMKSSVKSNECDGRTSFFVPVGFVVLGILELSCVPRTDDDLTGGATEHVPEACDDEVGFKERSFGMSGTQSSVKSNVFERLWPRADSSKVGRGDGDLHRGKASCSVSVGDLPFAHEGRRNGRFGISVSVSGLAFAHEGRRNSFRSASEDSSGDGHVGSTM